MDLIPPDQRERLFDDSRRQQQHYVQTAEIQRNLRETTETALRVLTVLAERGETLDKQEEHARLVMESSEAMVWQAEIISGSNWCCCCFRRNRAAVPTPSPPPTVVPSSKKRQIFRFSK